jgi:hypothetical protein
MAIITATRPDPRFYQSILQHDDGNFESEQKPLNDSTSFAAGFSSTGVITALGLRSQTKLTVDAYAQRYILNSASADAQRQALKALSTTTSGPAHDNAVAMFAWIDSVNAYAATIKNPINTMTFDQIVVFVIPNTGWPPPPVYSAVASSSASYQMALSKLV